MELKTMFLGLGKRANKRNRSMFDSLRACQCNPSTKNETTLNTRCQRRPKQVSEHLTNREAIMKGAEAYQSPQKIQEGRTTVTRPEFI
jgi:hypothetical protein